MLRTPWWDRQAVLLDVREPHELQSASVGSSTANPAYRLVTIPMSLVPLRLAELNPEQPTACLCHHGARSLRVAAFLQHNGFEKLANITGGIDAWSHENDSAVPRY